MSLFAARTNCLRARTGDEAGRVTFVELFFDLVFVFAVTQLSHGLLDRLTPLGALQTAILMFAVIMIVTWNASPYRTRGMYGFGRFPFTCLTASLISPSIS